VALSFLPIGFEVLRHRSKADAPADSGAGAGTE
jgi:hypothetical protein